MGVTRSNSEPSSKQNYRPKSTPPEHGELDRVDIMDTNTANLNSISNKLLMMDNLLSLIPSTSTHSLSSVGSQDSVVDGTAARKSRQQILEERHQDLLKKQKRLQEQYVKLQQLSRVDIPKNILNELKKTGSESNIQVVTHLNKGRNQVPNGLNCSAVQNGYHASPANANDIAGQQKQHTKNPTSLSSPNKTNQLKMNKSDKTDLSSTETQKLFESSII